MRLQALLLGTAALLMGCRENAYLSSYTATNYTTTLSPVAHVRVINVGCADPVAVYSRDFASDELVGTSDWVGIEDIQDSCASVAKKVGADVVLWSKLPAGTQEVQSSVLVPTQQTAQYSGMVNTPYGARSYSGLSTSYGTQAVPYSMAFQRYEYRAVYVRTSSAK